jgi:hypothetical protein
VTEPNFSGQWKSVSHDNMELFLVARGFPASNAALASRATVVQSIVHTRRSLVVTVQDTVTSYAITGGWLADSTLADDVAEAEEETKAEAASEQRQQEDLAAALLQHTAEWTGAKDNRRLVSSTGDIDTERHLLDAQTMRVTSTARQEDGPDIVATTTFTLLQ